MSETTGLPLDDYIAQTLVGIVEGVLKAQANATAGAYVGRSPLDGASVGVAKDESRNAITSVSFDLATTIEDNAQSEGGTTIKVLPLLSEDSKTKSELRASSVNRLSFSVPVAIPMPSAQRTESQNGRRQSTGIQPRGGSNDWMAQ